MKLGKMFWLMMIIAVFAVAPAMANIIENPGLETQRPAFWNPDQLGGDLIWADDYANEGLMSLKISKAATGGVASWKSVNQAQTYWNHMEGVLYTVGGFIKTEGVNTNPASDAEKIGIKFEFLDDSGNTIVDDVYLWADQSSANTDWTEYTTEVMLSAVPAECYATLIMNTDATGVAWFDQFTLGSDPWTAGFFGWSAENPTGWMSWSAGEGAGYARAIASDYCFGDYCVKLEENDDVDDEMVFYSVPAAANPNSYYYISVMVRMEDMNTDASFHPTDVTYDRLDARASLCFFFHRGDINTSWDLSGGDQFLNFDQRTEMSDGWVKYWTIVESPEDATGLSMRARLNPTAMGTVYYDKFSAVEVGLGDNLVNNGDLESMNPFFWSVSADDNGTFEWSEAQAVHGSRSLMINKTATGGAAYWESDNHAQTYWNHMEAVLYTVGGSIMTDGVNTNPASDAEKVGIRFEFLDDSGNNIVDDVWVYADQSTGSTDWAEYTEEVMLSAVPATVKAYAGFGDGATGTAYFDQFVLGSDPWTAGFFGADCHTSEGWMYWSSDTDIGVAELYNAGDDAHSGDYVARLYEADDLGDEIVYYTVPTALEAGRMYQFSVWVKTLDVSPNNENYYTSSVMYDRLDDRANLCFFFHRGDIEHSWDLTGGDQFMNFDQRETVADWTHYTAVAEAPEDATGASMRARFNPSVQGEIYFDDFEIRQLENDELAVGDNPSAPGSTQRPTMLYLGQNYPNPFNSTTSIRYILPSNGSVQLEVFDVLGRHVATLVNEVQTSGTHFVNFDINEIGGSSSGSYFYRLSTPDGMTVRKMIFIK